MIFLKVLQNMTFFQNPFVISDHWSSVNVTQGFHKTHGDILKMWELVITTICDDLKWMPYFFQYVLVKFLKKYLHEFHHVAITKSLRIFERPKAKSENEGRFSIPVYTWFHPFIIYFLWYTQIKALRFHIWLDVRKKNKLFWKYCSDWI